MILKVVIGAVLIAHGIGHVLGWFPIFGWARSTGWTGDSWVLSGAVGQGPTNVIGFVLWGVSMVGFVLVGLGVLGLPVPATWLRPLAVLAAITSLLAVGLFWDAIPALSGRIGSIAVDVLVLWAVLVGHWPSSDVVPG
jgi:hypothetical protein